MVDTKDFSLRWNILIRQIHTTKTGLTFCPFIADIFMYITVISNVAL